jgi:hypothetical protein
VTKSQADISDIDDAGGNLAQSSMPPHPPQATLDDFELGEEIAWGSLATVGFKVFVLSI